MDSRNARREPPAVFTANVEALSRARLRPEIVLAELPAPQRIAPFSSAVSAEVVLPGPDEPLASGRFIVLHDPDEPEAWDGAWRLVTFASAVLEPEFASDPLLGEVGWSWLTEALTEAELPHRCLGGTVTRVVSESFGALADREPSVEVEIRASWTVEGEDLAGHLSAWTDLLCTVAGLPPLPPGVTALTRPRR